MGIFDKIFARNEEVEIKPLVGLDVIKAFTTSDEPQVRDYPKGQYKGFWETILGEVPGGYTAVVRFYGYAGHEDIFQEHVFTAPTIDKLRPAVHALIREKMETFKR